MPNGHLASRAKIDLPLEEIEALAEEANKIIAAMGPPGTGKTAVVHDQIRKWKRRGARILFVLPTGALSSRMKQKHPDIDVDTCHAGLLLHKNEKESVYLLQQYDLIIIDEIS